MRTTLKQSLATLAALAALMLSGTACTQDDPLGNNPAPGTALLALGEVTIAGAETAPAPGTTRSAAANGGTTRADASGFTGIRKSSFIAGDELILTLTDDKDVAAAPVTAKLNQDNTTWTLPKTYFTAGTTLSATYSPATQPGGITYKDDLTTGANPVKLPTDGTKATITLLHANALVEVTPPKDIVCTDLTISATPAGTDADPTPKAVNLGVAQQGSTANSDLRYLTIAPADSKLGTISLKVNDMTYTTTLNPEVQVEANKRYPIALTINGDKLEATVGTSTDWGNSVDVDGLPAGYDYYIRTPQDLVDFAKAVNADATTDGSGARSATAIQLADIDMTGVDWTPIGINATRSFRGSYNGNGYSISNLTMIKTSLSGDNYMGLFGHIKATKITGVHLRECNIKGNGGSNIYAGAIAGYAAWGNIITLCSATGSVEATADNTRAGGLVGYNPKNAEFNYYTRCNVDVDVTTTSVSHHYTCAFTGYSANVTAAACIASGTVTANNTTTGLYSGFGYTNDKADPYRTIGCITNSKVTNDIKIGFGIINTVLSCLATQPSYSYFCKEATTVTDNVSLGAHTSSTTANPAGVSIEVSAANAYGLLTANNVASPIKIKTLHYSKKDGYTTDVVERYWYAKGIWKDNGTDLPTIDMSYEGGAVPIIPGNNVYSVNGYWVTAPESEIERYLWTTGNQHEATMTPDPCAAGASNGWRMPIMKDFEAMLGWTGTHNWDKEITNNQYHNIVDDANFTKAFPVNNNYWSSTHNSIAGLTTNAWCFKVDAAGTTGAYSSMSKSNRNRIRCVQLQKTTP